MSDNRNPLLRTLKDLFRKAMSCMSVDNATSCLNILQTPYTFDDSLQHCDIRRTEDFVDAVQEFADCDDAFENMSDLSVMRMQCQLDLAKGLAALSSSQEHLFCESLANSLERASFLEYDRHDNLDRIVKAAIVLNGDCAFTEARLSLCTARRYIEMREWERASEWLDRITEEELGPLERSYKYAQAEVAKHNEEQQPG